MLPDRVSNPGPLTYESGALPIALHGLANLCQEVGLRDMLDKNQLPKYLQCICKLSYVFNFITKKTNYAKVLIKLAFLRYQMYLNDNETGLIQGFYPSIKYYKSFLNNLIFVSNQFKNSKVPEQNLMKMNKS